MDTVSLNSSVSLNEVIIKKTRGRPKLTDEQKKERKEKIKEYNKEYRELNKDKIANYECLKYDKSGLERTKKNNKKYNEIIKVIKQLYFNNLIIINDNTLSEKLTNLLKDCKNNI